MTAVRAAASLVVVDHSGSTPKVLMGKRGKGASFMPSKYVFPGGGYDASDAALAYEGQLSETDIARLHYESSLAPEALALCALRELREETGQDIKAPRGLPFISPLRFIFRAVTPKGLPRRYDARFFMVDRKELTTDTDDFSQTDAELSALSWLTLPDALSKDIPFVTRMVLEHVRSGAQTVPFIRNDTDLGEISFIPAS